MEEDLELWVIYRHPTDYPDKFVARKWKLDKPTEVVKISNTLDEVRKMLPPNLILTRRYVDDDPNIVEVWL